MHRRAVGLGDLELLAGEKLCVSQAGTTEPGTAQVGPREIGTAKVRQLDVDALHPSVYQHCPGEIGSVELARSCSSVINWKYAILVQNDSSISCLSRLGERQHELPVRNDGFTGSIRYGSADHTVNVARRAISNPSRSCNALVTAVVMAVTPVPRE